MHAYTRRDLPTTTSTKQHTIASPESSTWPSLYPSGTRLFISGLGTTRAQAGSFDAQYAIDHDLNLALARGAKAAGCSTYVLISSAGANSGSYFAYPRMKGELEDAVQALGFEHVVLVRPGMIVGTRRDGDSRPLEFAFRKVAGAAGMLSERWCKDFWAQDSVVIARAAVAKALECVEGREGKKVVVLGQSDIIRLGRTEWGQNGSGKK